MHATAPYVLTLIAPAGRVLHLPQLVSNLPSAHEVWLNDRNRHVSESTALDVYLSRDLNETERKAVTAACEAAQIDFVLQPTANREKKLLISDMDSTMIEQECIDELADKVGLKPRVAAITERAMNGELDFKAALRERVALLKGLPESTLQEVFNHHITPMAGAKTVVATMKARGASTHLVSGGFTFFTERVADALAFDTHEANMLVLADGKLTGTVREPILDKDAKLAALEYHAARHKLPLAATLAVGDGANDLPMILASGLGVAYHAKPAVRSAAQASITHNDLTALLYAQGISREQWIEPERTNGKGRAA
jgi:phosphoserine phosphatase